MKKDEKEKLRRKIYNLERKIKRRQKRKSIWNDGIFDMSVGVAPIIHESLEEEISEMTKELIQLEKELT